MSFGYNQVESETEYLDGPALARHLTDCVSRGGRFLLNVGPKADGTLPALQRTALTRLGDWMADAKPHLVAAQPVADAASDSIADTTTDSTPDGPFVRWLGHADRLVAVIDLAGDRFADQQPAGEVTVAVPASVAGITSAAGGEAGLTGDQLTVRLSADRVGPALVVLRRT